MESIASTSTTSSVSVDSNRDSYSILIVEDSAPVMKLIERVLTKSGFSQLRTSTDGLSGLEAAAESCPDLVISDIRMPNMSGVEMAEAICDAHGPVPFIFVTGYTDYSALSRAIRLQPIGFLEKPFEPKQLQSLVERAFDQRQRQLERQEIERQLRDAVAEKTKELAFRSERLLAEKQLLQGIIAEANFGLLAVDSNRILHVANRFALDALGAPQELADNYHGQPLRSVLNDDNDKHFASLFDKVVAERSLQAIQYTNKCNERSLHTIAYPVLFRDQLSAVVFVIHDVTENEVLQRRLLQTSKLASIGELAAGVAHEINNPLGFVTSNCNSLTEYVDTLSSYVRRVEEGLLNAGLPVTEESLKALREELDIDFVLSDCPSLLKETLDGLSRVSKIVMDLKTFARVDADQPQSANVNDLIKDSLNLVRNETKYKVNVHTDLGQCPEIACYPGQLVQVMTNIFVNACHATPEKGDLRVRSIHRGEKIFIEIQDTGTGISEDIQEKIFDPFFTTKDPGKGTGMGLSIAYGIVEKHGGRLSVDSTIGQGSTFTIELPVKSGLNDESGREA